MPNRRPTWRDIAIPLIVGVFSLATVMRRPRFVSIHTIDVLELIAAGLMFGLALRALAMWMHDLRLAKNRGYVNSVRAERLFSGVFKLRSFCWYLSANR